MKTLRIEYPVEAFAYPHIPIPQLWRVRHLVANPRLDDPALEVARAARPLLQDPRIRPGASVAIGVGSRGLNNLQPMVRAIVRCLKEAGTYPFIVPAMGSHGGAVAEGQRTILGDYGIDEERVGAPVRATMEVIQVGQLSDGYPVYCDRFAAEADAVIVLNRIKPHTDFTGDIESGICKILAIGLGKQKGADTIHRFGAQGLRHVMPEVGRTLVKTVNVIGGIGVIENARGETAEVHALRPDEIGQDRERELLKHAKSLSPMLAFEQVDVLVLDEMGKNISGAGMDTHVIGRVEMPSLSESDWDGPTVRVLCVLSLTAESHGNAAGFGLADMMPQRLIEQIDFNATMMNHRTSGEGGVRRTKLPIILPTPDDVIRSAIGACGRGRPEEVRLARIRNTEFVTTLEVSEPLLNEVRSRSDMEIIEGPFEPNFETRMAHG